ncbi:MAG TPA: exonuclease domain-containing protein, partial [Burkholderiales bacterium]|nr:exonuclease domain-containing protein [Burkholderiales bacterium]
GAQPAWDRVTEIGVIEIDGFAVSSEWSTLVNPGASIPAPIQALTGITNEMVAAAPSFRELAGALFERLAGRVFVAHNARFDYGFLRHEFERAGLKFMAKTLCTVRLSRRLYAAHASHNLDSLIARHGIACRARHRALGDADAVWQFLRIAAQEHGDEILAVAARQIARQPALPPHIDRAVIDAIPEAPGVYLFYGEGGAPLYVGKSVSLRSRVLSHFCCGLRSQKATELSREVRRIDWQRTVGELGALLREAKLVKALQPAYNRQLRRPESLCGFVFDMKRLRLAHPHEIDGETLPYVYGLFRSRRDALEALRGLADEHRLCLQALGFETPVRPRGCWRFQLGKCEGACAGRENIHVHHGRVAQALARLKAIDWPHPGPLGVVERDRNREATEVHVVDRWCYLGAARSDAELAELVGSARRPPFDYDEYRILARHLAKKSVRTLRLTGCTAS